MKHMTVCPTGDKALCSRMTAVAVQHLGLVFPGHENRSFWWPQRVLGSVGVALKQW